MSHPTGEAQKVAWPSFLKLHLFPDTALECDVQMKLHSNIGTKA